MSSFTKSNRGSVATMVGLSLPLVLFAGGAAVDTGYAVMLRGELVQITRLACTRLSTSAADFATASQQSDVTTTVIASLLAESRLDEDQTAFTFSPASGGSASVEAQSIYQTNFLQVFGLDQVGLAAKEVCVFDLRLPTARPDTSCDVTVSSRPVNSSVSLTLADAVQEWQEYNENCVTTWVPDGGYRDSSGNWITDYTDQTSCSLPAIPDEIIATVLTESVPVRVVARTLLTTDSSRGVSAVAYDDLPAGELALQPVNGFPVSLPEACEPVPQPIVLPPPPPHLPPLTPPSFPSGAPSSPIVCEVGPVGLSGGSGLFRVSPGGTITSSITTTVTDSCGNQVSVTSDNNVRDGIITNTTTTDRNGEIATTTATGIGNEIQIGVTAGPDGPRSWVYGPSGGLNISGVGAWL